MPSFTSFHLPFRTASWLSRPRKERRAATLRAPSPSATHYLHQLCGRWNSNSRRLRNRGKHIYVAADFTYHLTAGNEAWPIHNHRRMQASIERGEFIAAKYSVAAGRRNLVIQSGTLLSRSAVIGREDHQSCSVRPYSCSVRPDDSDSGQS